MSPVMARCRHSWPIRECTECAPPFLFAPVVPPDDGDPYGVLDDEVPPPVVVTIALGGVTVTAVAVLGGVAVAAWAVGAVIGALRGGPWA